MKKLFWVFLISTSLQAQSNLQSVTAACGPDNSRYDVKLQKNATHTTAKQSGPGTSIFFAGFGNA